jgi:hypothetical protein
VDRSWEYINRSQTHALYQERAVFGKMKMDPAKRAQTQNAGEVSLLQGFFSQSIEQMIGYLGFLGIDLFKSVLMYSNGAICLIKLLFDLGLFTVWLYKLGLRTRNSQKRNK